MNNAGFLADDFQQIKAKSDDAVFEMLRKKDSETVDEKKPLAKKIAKSVEILPQKKADRPQISKPTNPVKKAKPKMVEPVQTAPKPIVPAEWGKPVTLFNTRIPQELSDLLDDLVYKSKKDGNPTTKQAIAIDALTKFFKNMALL